MKKWKVIIEKNGKQTEIIISGERYSNVYIETSNRHPGHEIISISEIRFNIS